MGAVEEIFDRVDINEVLSNGFADYSKYVIQSRAIPDIRDGLKPVQRRILYSMYRNRLTADKPYRKSARTVGDVIGTLSPHGDSSVYEAMVRMAQDWKTNIPLVDIHGNKGSVDGDGAAAMRYTEARLGKIVEDGFFSGVDKEGVIPKQNNYDDTLKEPVVLPAKFPNLLVNGASGIASGYATEIPPHNLKEVLEACILLLKKPSTTLEDVLEIVPAPDFPTGGVVVGARKLKGVYTNGNGSVELRSNYAIEKKGNRKLIIVTEIPYGVNKSKLVSDMDEVAEGKKVVGLKKCYDESSREGMRIVIECDKNADERVVLSYLFKNTELQSNFNMNLTVIDNKKPKQLGIYEIIKSFNEFRLETRRKELEYDLRKLKEKLHIVDGYVKLIDILDEVIEVIRDSKGRKGSKDAIKKEFGFSEEQASAIVDLQLYRISREDKERYEQEQKKLNKLIEKLEKLLESKKGVINNVIKQYEKIIKEYGVDRKTKVIYEDENWEVSKADVIKEVDVRVAVTEKGYVKRSSTRSYGSTDVNGIVDGDNVVLDDDATTKSHILLFTNKNNYMYLPVYELKETRWGDEGSHLSILGVELGQDEYVVSAFVVEEEDKDKYVLIAKSNGLVKRTSVEDHYVSRHFNLYISSKERDNEELMGAWLVGDEGYIGFITKDKRAMYFSIDEIAPKGLKTKGMAGVRSKEDDYVKEVIFRETQEEMKAPYVLRKRGQTGVKVK